MKDNYLSEIVHLEDFAPSCLNLVDSSCGSGKTTFSIKHLPKINPNEWDAEILYLIDTKLGKEQLLESEGTFCGYNFWSDEEIWRIDKIRVMTYASYAFLYQKAPEKDRWQENTLILCDELHQAIKCSKWNTENNLHKVAIDLIHQKINFGNNIVVAISATTDSIRKEFAGKIKNIPLYGEPRHYIENEVIKYNDLSLLLRSIDKSKRGIVFVSQIKQILKYQRILDERGIRTGAIWSVNNDAYPLTDEQHKIRKYIIENKQIPENIDVLFINKSSETSASFGLENQSSGIDYMIIHSTEKDTQIQVRGRYRKDLNTLYLHDPLAQKVVNLDDKWLNRELTKTDKKVLCNELNIWVNGRQLRWPSIKCLLCESGYMVQDVHKNEGRYSVINRDKNVVLS